MALLQWSEKLCVGVAEMDRQHQRLVELVNRLYDAMSSGKGDDVKKEILTGLITYTKVHFAAEERLMAQYGYPHLASHKGLHDALTSKVVQLNEKVQKGQMVPSVSLSSFLKDWLVKHIVQEDSRYGQFISAPVA